MKAWARVFDAIQILNITCYSVATYTAKLYNHTVPNKGTQVIDSPASTFKGLGYKETAMVNSYN